MTTISKGRFTILPILVIFAGSILITGFTDSNHAAENKMAVDHSINDFFKDAISPQDPPDQNKKSDSTTSKLGKLIKQFIGFFNFKDKRRKQIISVINEFRKQDSIAALHKLPLDIKKDERDTIWKQYYTTLTKMVNSEIAKDSLLNDHNQQDVKKNDTLIKEILDQIHNKNIVYAAGIVADQDFTLPANQNLPVIKLADDIKKESAKQARLTTLKHIRDSLSITRTKKDSLSNGQYRVSLKNKIDVYGFYNNTTGKAVQHNKFGYLNAFIYDSLFINSKTGEITDIRRWREDSITTIAQKDGYDVGVSFACKDPDEAGIFLNKPLLHPFFIKQAIELMNARSCKIINLSFNNIPAGSGYGFFNVAQRLYDEFKKDSSHKLLITIPAAGSANYPLSELSKIADRVIIDFSAVSKKTSNNPQPLASIEDLNNTLAYFIKSGILKEKIVVCLPYRGVKWQVKDNRQYVFSKYVPYKETAGASFSGYKKYYPDSLASFAVMDSFRNGDVDKLASRIYYDDVSTMSRKYEFIVNLGFRGIAVKYLGDDSGHSGLWDEMAYSFAEPDTAWWWVKKDTYTKDPGISDLQRYSTLYFYILQNPCVTCFENIRESDKRAELQQYLVDLDINRQIFDRNQIFIAKQKLDTSSKKKADNTWRSAFNYLSDQLTYLLLEINEAIFILLLAVGSVYVYNIVKKGDSWATGAIGKTTGIAFIVLCNLLVLFIFTWAFSNDLLPFFGYRSSNNNGYSKDYIEYLQSNAKTNPKMAAFLQELYHGNTEPGANNNYTGYCSPDPASNCVNLPLSKLLIIILVALLIGYFFTRTLIMRVIKKDPSP